MSAGSRARVPARALFVVARQGSCWWCALVENGRVVELDIVRDGEQRLAGAVFKARVRSDRAVVDGVFVELGLARAGLLVAGRDRRGASGLRAGDEVLVQVAREPEPGKGARVRREIVLAGDRLLLLPGRDGVGVSRRITEPDERERLARELRSLEPAGARLVARSAARGTPGDALRRECAGLVQRRERIERSAATSPAPVLLAADDDPRRVFVRERLSCGADRIVWDSGRASRDDSPDPAAWPVPIERHRGPRPAVEAWGLDRALDEIRRAEVPLAGGGRLLIEHTAAVVAIDVDAAGRRGPGSGSDPFLDVALAALPELVRQIRLRDLGGTIVVDFPSPRTSSGHETLAATLERALSADPASPVLRGLSASGLAEIGRRRLRAARGAGAGTAD